MFSLDDEYILFTLEEVWIKSTKENCKTCLVKDSVDGSLYIKKEISDKSSLYIYKALKNIKHQNLPEILHVIESENGFVIIEEYIHGSSLKEKLSDSEMLSESQVMDYTIQLCCALEFLHSMNPLIIHRDVKPSNIICSNDGVIKLTDFDAAKGYNALASEDTVTLGTKAYAAPEQFGYAKVDHKTDIYCVGATMFQLLTGTLFVPKSNLNLYNGRLKNVIKKCVQIDPDNRYESIEGLKRDLEEIRSGKTYKMYVFPDLKFASPCRKSIFITLYIIVWFIIATLIWLIMAQSMTDSIVEIIQTACLLFIALVVPYSLICNIFGIRNRIPLFRKKTMIHQMIAAIITTFILAFTFVIVFGILEELKAFFS